jgi:ABC-type Co2+ transport system permease subunit
MATENNSMDLQEVVKRAVKYLIEGAAVAIALYLIGKDKLNIEEILLVALTAAAVFAILDMFAPSISYAARQGAGFGLGANLVGFPNMGGVRGVVAPGTMF